MWILRKDIRLEASCIEKCEGGIREILNLKIFYLLSKVCGDLDEDSRLVRLLRIISRYLKSLYVGKKLKEDNGSDEFVLFMEFWKTMQTEYEFHTNNWKGWQVLWGIMYLYCPQYMYVQCCWMLHLSYILTCITVFQSLRLYSCSPLC